LPEAHKALAPVFGIESFAGGVVLDFLAFEVTLLLCFVAGLLARRASATRMREKLDTTLLNSFPGYAFVKGFTDNLRQTEEMAGSFFPVAVQFDDYVQIASETHPEPSGKVSVYQPGAPNPWSGTVVYAPSERVKPLPITLTEALRNIRTLGKGPIDISGQACATDQAAEGDATEGRHETNGLTNRSHRLLNRLARIGYCSNATESE
jgi:uncharacterized membrane protein